LRRESGIFGGNREEKGFGEVETKEVEGGHLYEKNVAS